MWTPRLRFHYERLLTEAEFDPAKFVTEDPDRRDSFPFWSTQRDLLFLKGESKVEVYACLLAMGFETWLSAEAALYRLRRKNRYVLWLNIINWDEDLPKPYLAFLGSEVSVGVRLLSQAYHRPDLSEPRFRRFVEAIKLADLSRNIRVYEQAFDPTLPTSLSLDFDISASPGKRLLGGSRTP